MSQQFYNTTEPQHYRFVVGLENSGGRFYSVKIFSLVSSKFVFILKKVLSSGIPIFSCITICMTYTLIANTYHVSQFFIYFFFFGERNKNSQSL